MMIISHAIRGGAGAILISDLFQCHFGSCKSLSFFFCLFLIKRDGTMGMVSLCSACQDLPNDIHVDFLRSFGLKGTYPEVKI